MNRKIHGAWSKSEINGIKRTLFNKTNLDDFVQS